MNELFSTKEKTTTKIKYSNKHNKTINTLLNTEFKHNKFGRKSRHSHRGPTGRMRRSVAWQSSSRVLRGPARRALGDRHLRIPQGGWSAAPSCGILTTRRSACVRLPARLSGPSVRICTCRYIPSVSPSENTYVVRAASTEAWRCSRACSAPLQWCSERESRLPQGDTRPCHEQRALERDGW